MPASYQPQGIVHHIGVVYPRRTNQLHLFIPKGHQLAAGTLVTLHLGTVEEKDHHNKVGVLTTLAQGQPRTTVLAFLSSLQDDVFLISMPGTFKSKVLKREPRCFFTIDERAKFTFEQSIEWNYTSWKCAPTSCPPHRRCTSRFAPRSS